MRESEKGLFWASIPTRNKYKSQKNSDFLMAQKNPRKHRIIPVIESTYPVTLTIFFLTVFCILSGGCQEENLFSVQ